MTAVAHGGDLSAAARLYGCPPGGWVDLSTGINPWPYPAAPEALALSAKLPDGALMTRLTRAAAACYGAGEDAAIVAGPGTQALIQWLPRLRPPGRVAILSPTYGEHVPAWQAAGHEVREVADLPAPGAFDVVTLVNPNNPDGRVVPAEALAAFAAAQAASGGWTVVDEAFADAVPGVSIAGRWGAGAVVLRSFGKFFGLPGLRLGFALGDDAIVSRLRAALGPWAVATPAAAIAVDALADTAWQAATRERLAAAAARLDALLGRAGLEVLGGTPLYRLARHVEAGSIRHRLGAAGIYVRHFEAAPDRLRFGLPGPDDAWDRLAAALGALGALGA